ncbi:unnamed protein product [Paramecium sonneborni]|uniref:Uncharacterized protein n=1 Tax=Paramecium sonneborni TaxID=65129 RepID=A0A8S1M1L3_9CILI|nr:unnamed protein product [Paramecium sonneborni]
MGNWMPNRINPQPYLFYDMEGSNFLHGSVSDLTQKQNQNKLNFMLVFILQLKYKKSKILISQFHF